MHKLIQFYYQNKNKIKFIVAFIIFLFIVIQFINKALKNDEINTLLGNTNNINNINNSYNNVILENDTEIISNESVVTGEKVNSAELNIVAEVIDNFISACNNGDIEQAYDLLSEDCKTVNYKDLQTFKKLYYDKVFTTNEKKTATIENWIENTYKVSLSGDVLATGKINNGKIQDYITVVKQNETFKLNINSFVDIEEINSQQIINDITVNILSKKIFMDYEEYIIKFDNKSNNQVILDAQENPNTMYLQDKNNVKYFAYSNEIMSSLLKINPGFSTQIKIKFERTYTSANIKPNLIIFSDVILNNNESSKRDIININI